MRDRHIPTVDQYNAAQKGSQEAERIAHPVYA